MKTARVAVLVSALLASCCSTVFAQEKVTLRFKEKAGNILKYDFNIGGRVDVEMKDVPTPGADVSAKNISGKFETLLYLDTLSADENLLVFDVKLQADT
ncbi:MAG: hypothetical protein AB1742_08890, partial [bacterium]